MPEVFQFEFMQRAFLASIVIGVIAPLIGIFLVVRRYSLMSDTLAHVSLMGVALGLLLNVSPIVAAIATSTLAALGIERLRETRRIHGESLLALFLSGSLAIAVVLISIANGFTVNLFSFLFGSVSTVGPGDLYLITILGLVVIATVVLLYKEFFFVSFDEEVARAYGVRSTTYNLVLAVLVAVTISLAMQVVGILLIGALTVIPVVSATQFSRSFRVTLLLAIAFSLVSVISGLLAAFYLDWASGGTIVLFTLVIFLLCLAVTKE